LKVSQEVLLPQRRGGKGRSDYGGKKGETVNFGNVTKAKVLFPNHSSYGGEEAFKLCKAVTFFRSLSVIHLNFPINQNYGSKGILPFSCHWTQTSTGIGSILNFFFDNMII